MHRNLDISHITLLLLTQCLLVMEELEPFVERPESDKISLSITKANFAWDKVRAKKV